MAVRGRGVVDVEGGLGAEAVAVEADGEAGVAGRDWEVAGEHDVSAGQVVVEPQLIVDHEQREAGGSSSVGEQDPVGVLVGAMDVRGDGERSSGEVGAEYSVEGSGAREEFVARPDRRGGVDGLGAFSLAVVKWQDVVALGLTPPGRDHVLDEFGVFAGSVLGFGAVLVDLVELPLVVLEGLARLVMGNDFPAITPESALAGGFEVLPVPRGRCVGVVEGIAHGHAVQRLLCNATVGLGRGHASEIEDGRGQIDDVVELVADAGLDATAGRGLDDERGPDTAGEGVGLVVLERGVAGLCPSRRVVVVRPGAAELVHRVDVVLEIVG